MCTLAGSPDHVNPPAAVTPTLERATFSDWLPSEAGSDRPAEHGAYSRPGAPRRPREVLYPPAWLVFSAWWPGSGIPSYDLWAPSSTWLPYFLFHRQLDALVPVELSQDLASIKLPDRRRGARIPGLVLTQAERDRSRSQASAVSRCGRSWTGFRRVIAGPSSCTMERLVAQRSCSTRLCPDCDALRRLRNASRVSGPWQSFVTIGVPSGSFTIRQAWLQMSGWIERLTKILRQNVSFDGTGPVQVDPDSADYCHLLKLSAGRVREMESGLDLAWAIEPHESGYPHLHFVTTAAVIDYAWMRRVWSQIIWSRVEWSKHKPVTRPDGVCRYLSKYVTKGQLPPDLLALMYRRRLYGCTLPLDIEAPTWTPESFAESALAAREVSNPASWGQQEGWQVALDGGGRYALWRRTVSWSELATHLPEHASESWLHSTLWLRALWPGFVHDPKKRAKIGAVHNVFFQENKWVEPIDVLV